MDGWRSTGRVVRVWTKKGWHKAKSLLSGEVRIVGLRRRRRAAYFWVRRNVRDRLRQEHHHAIDSRIQSAYGMATYEQVRQSLKLTVKHLEHMNPSAAASFGGISTSRLLALTSGPVQRGKISSTSAIFSRSVHSSSRKSD